MFLPSPTDPGAGKMTMDFFHYFSRNQKGWLLYRTTFHIFSIKFEIGVVYPLIGVVHPLVEFSPKFFSLFFP